MLDSNLSLALRYKFIIRIIKGRYFWIIVWEYKHILLGLFFYQIFLDLIKVLYASIFIFNVNKRIRYENVCKCPKLG